MSVNFTKCIFIVMSLSFLGHVIDKDGYRSNTDRVTIIHEWPLFGQQKRVATFLGSVNFYPKTILNYIIIRRVVLPTISLFGSVNHCSVFRNYQSVGIFVREKKTIPFRFRVASLCICAYVNLFFICDL